MNSQSSASLQMSALELCLYFACHLLRKESPSLSLVELALVLFVVRQSEFLEDDLGVNQMQKIDYQKRFPVIQTYSMCQEAGVCRGSAWNENLESLQVHWKRKTISHCNLIPLLKILLEFICSCISCNWEVSFCIDSWFSLFFCTDIVNSQFLNSLHFSHFVHTSDLSISENLFLLRKFFL